MDYKIKKLWGENAAQLSKSAKNILHDYTAWNVQVVVVSAMRSPEFNTTDKLILIWKLLQNEKVDVNQVEWLVDQLEQFHLDTLEEKILCSKESLIDLVEKSFVQFRKNISYFVANSWDKTIPNDGNDYCIETDEQKPFSILWFGEAISCRVFSSVIDTVSPDGIISKSVDLSNIIKQWDLDGKDEKTIFNHLSVLLSGIIEEKIVWWYIPVLSGYMWSFSEGIEAAIWRGYSDATAAVCTVWLAQRWHWVILEIQKSVKWLLSADPRILENSSSAILIPELDYLTASDIVRNYYWVDIVSASESEISFTIDWNNVAEKTLQKMTQEIKDEFWMWENNSMEFVEHRTNKSLIFCVGQHMKNYVWLLARATKILWENNINIEIASQWRLQRAMIFWIDEKDMKKAVNVLHQEFITTL